MKNKDFIKSVPKRSKKPKKQLSYYIAVTLIAFSLFASWLGLAGFCMQVFAEELPTDYTLEQVIVGENIGDRFIQVNEFAYLTISIDNLEYRLYLDTEYPDEVQVFPPDYTEENPTDFNVSLPYLDNGIFYLDTEEFTFNGISNDGTFLYVSGNVLLVVPVSVNSNVFIVSAIIGILTAGLITFATGFGSGLSSLVSSIFMVNGALSPFAIMVVVFSALALAIGLSRLVVKMLSKWGG